MKRILLAVVLVLLCSAYCLAIIVTVFSNTDLYLERAEDIVIAECLSTQERLPSGTLVEVDIKMVLKGDKNPGKSKVFTIYSMQAGNRYLLMNSGGSIQGTDFLATAELSVVPIASFVNTDVLKEKTLKDKLSFIFDSRLYALERELEPLMKEKSLLEKALIDRIDNLYISPKPVHIGKTYTTQATGVSEGKLTYLNFNSREMMWSRKDDQSGYIYSDVPDLKGPEWEFASIEYSTFQELEAKRLKVRFSSIHIPPGGCTMVVRTGQMVLARHIDEPNKVYVIRFERRVNDKVFVRYAVIDGVSK